MKVYLVGGALRDRLLGLPVAERDWVVVGATEAEMVAQGYTRLDGEFPVFIHPQSGEEYALARTETKQGQGYKGFVVSAGPEVTLAQDLKRRDFTINAMAEDAQGELIDPYQGQEDLGKRVLRHISPAFNEDPLRLLRAARFAARLDFEVAEETQQRMVEMAASGELSHLSPERVWKEMERALGERYPWRFFEVLHSCGAGKVLFPALTEWMEQNPDHPSAVLRSAVSINCDSRVRFVVVMAEALQGQHAETFCQQLRVPKPFCELLLLVQNHQALIESATTGEPSALLAVIRNTRAQQRPQRWQRFLQSITLLYPESAAEMGANFEAAMGAISGIDIDTLKERGLSGSKLGDALADMQLTAIRAVLSK